MSNKWQPITDYETPPEQLADPELRTLTDQWGKLKAHLMASGSGNLRRFAKSLHRERLQREWAIETGLIERLYTLDRGITVSLIEKGVHAVLDPHDEIDDSRRAAMMILDQEAALENVFAFVKGEFPLSTSYIKELHQIFTQHQEYVEGVDSLGNKVQEPLISGDYKKRPNNPLLPSKKIHYYCPPVHVQAEMEALIQMHKKHDDIAPEVEAAWLHHRFTQIHPFQDGNGRVARALASLIFIKAKLLPLVIRDNERDRYLDSLVMADEGNIKPLIWFFSESQRRELIKVIDIAGDILSDLAQQKIENINQRITVQRESKSEKEKRKNSVDRAEHLRGFAKDRMEIIRSSLDTELRKHGAFTLFIDHEDDQGERSHYFQRQIVATAKKLNYYANTRSYRSWVRLGIQDNTIATQGNILLSFHMEGHQFRENLVCSGTWFQRVPIHVHDQKTRESEGEIPLCDDVFRIDHKEDIVKNERCFRDWLEQVLERGLAAWEKIVLT